MQFIGGWGKVLGQSRVPEGLRVYAVGDTHGCLNETRLLLAMIEQDLTDRPVDDYRIVFLGDYLDRGPQSKRLVYFLIGLLSTNGRVICLCGNHDALLLKFLAAPTEQAEVFFRNGGAATLRSYGVNVVSDDYIQKDLETVHAYFSALMTDIHVKFLSELPGSITFGDYFFCHAGVRPGIALKAQDEDDLMWIRDDFLDHREPFEKVIIHGHTARKEVDVQTNRINIDTRCYASGVLTAVALEGADFRFLQTG